MDEQVNRMIFISTSIGETIRPRLNERGLASTVSSTVLQAIPVDTLKYNIQCFFDQLSEVLTPGADRVGNFEISEIRVDAEITGDGQVSLLGSGAKIGVHGGITLILTRKPTIPPGE